MERAGHREHLSDGVIFRVAQEKILFAERNSDTTVAKVQRCTPVCAAWGRES
tara:strand:- start:329 stop:484 length:156 start_codon:yes stop_codon:yes gene_type:complete